MTRKVIRKRVRLEEEGVQVAADLNAVIATNVRRGRTSTSAKSRQRVVATSARKRPAGKRPESEGR
jgi:hypothetical protein